MSDPTLYLMSKYTGREADSLKENQDAWLALDAKGYLVYSPICENHNIEERRQCLHICPKCKTKKLFWNMRLRYDQSICSDCGQIYKDMDLIEEYKEPDYVARDLRLIENWLKHDSNEFLHQGCGGVVHDIGGDQGMCFKCREYCDLKTTELYNHYDSGVIGVMLPSAYHYPNSTSTYNIELGFIWDSKRAKAEYEFCKAHYILVIPLEIALTVPRDQWREYGL